MTQKEDIFLKNLANLTEVPIRVYSIKKEFCIAYERRPVQYRFDKQEKITELLLQESENRFRICNYEPEVPVAICSLRTDCYLFLLGPFSYDTLNNKALQRYLMKNHISEFPCCQLQQVHMLAELILNQFCQEEICLEPLQHIAATEESYQNETTMEFLHQVDTFQENHTYYEESAIDDLIRKGDVEGIREYFKYGFPQHPIVLKNYYKNEEYMVVTAISMAARSAIQGGLTSQEGYLISDIFLKKLEACTTVEELQKVMYEAFLYCAKEVRKKQKLNSRNWRVEQCKKAVISRRLKKISLDEIADEIGISKEYMLKLFRKETGEPLQTYIAKIKIEAACNILKYSDKKIGEIAEYLGYASFSYFSREFRKIMGISPLQYRKEVGNNY